MSWRACSPLRVLARADTREGLDLESLLVDLTLRRWPRLFLDMGDVGHWFRVEEFWIEDYEVQHRQLRPGMRPPPPEPIPTAVVPPRVLPPVRTVGPDDPTVHRPYRIRQVRRLPRRRRGPAPPMPPPGKRQLPAPLPPPEPESPPLSVSRARRLLDEETDRPSARPAPAGLACESRAWILRGLYQEQWGAFLDHTYYPHESDRTRRSRRMVVDT